MTSHRDAGRCLRERFDSCGLLRAAPGVDPLGELEDRSRRERGVVEHRTVSKAIKRYPLRLGTKRRKRSA